MTIPGFAPGAAGAIVSFTYGLTTTLPNANSGSPPNPCTPVTRRMLRATRAPCRFTRPPPSPSRTRDMRPRCSRLQKFGNIYTRIMNPTTDVFEQRVAALEGGIAGLATVERTSGAVPGDHQPDGPGRRNGGGQHAVRRHLYADGCELPAAWASMSNSWSRTTRKTSARRSPRKRALLYGETIANPRMNVLDIEAVSKIAHEAGVPLVIDNTMASPYLCRPIEHGADIVVHSATKFLGGHGTSIGGIIVDSGKFAWTGQVSGDHAAQPGISRHEIQPKSSDRWRT